MILTCCERLKFRGGDVHFVQENAACFLSDTPESRIADGARLLKDFLEHEMLVAAFFGHDRVPEDVLNLAVDGVTVEVGQLNAVRSKDRHIAIGEEKHVARVAQDGGHVGRDEVLAFAEADYDRGTFAGGNNLIRVITVDHGEREDAADLLERGADRSFQIPVEVFFDHVSDYFGIGLGFKNMAFALELFLQRQEVFDDAVVNDNDVAGTIAVRMGVFFAGAAVGCPAGMADAVIAFDRIDSQNIFEVAEFAGSAADSERLIVTVDGESG